MEITLPVAYSRDHVPTQRQWGKGWVGVVGGFRHMYVWANLYAVYRCGCLGIDTIMASGADTRSQPYRSMQKAF